MIDKLLDLRNKADFSELSKLEEKNEKILKLAKLCNEICSKPENENLSKTLNLSEFSLELLLSVEQKPEKAISIEILAYNNLGIIHLRYYFMLKIVYLGKQNKKTWFCFT